MHLKHFYRVRFLKKYFLIAQDETNKQTWGNHFEIEFIKRGYLFLSIFRQ